MPVYLNYLRKEPCNLTSLPEKVTFTLCDNHCSKTLNFIEVLNMPERTELVDKIVLNSLQTYFENWPLATAGDIVIFTLTVTTLTVATLTLDSDSYKKLKAYTSAFLSVFIYPRK